MLNPEFRLQFRSSERSRGLYASSQPLNIVACLKYLSDTVICRSRKENSYIGAGVFDVPRYHLKARDNLQDRWRYLHSLTVPSVKEWSFIRLPESLDYLHYLLRPIRLGVEHGFIPLLNQVNQFLK